MVRRRDVLRLGAASAAAMLAAPVLADSTVPSGGTLLVTHPAFLNHHPGIMNPERPARMTSIDGALSVPAFASLRREPAPLRDDFTEAVLRVHDRALLERIAAAAADTEHLPHAFDADTAMSKGSWDAARRAVGAGLLAVDRVMERGSGVTNAFCQIRPPGHHAERDRIMGFCLFNNVAVAAAYARARHGVERVAIVDFDVHHGNGTQEIFWSERDTFYGSTHQMPLFPGTGAAGETGAGNICNAPLVAGDDGVRFREAMTGRVLPALDVFRPDLILLSAGFDGHAGDPLGGLRLVAEDFAWITTKLAEAAHRHCGGRLVSLLEGGYALRDLAHSSAAHVGALMAGA